MVLEILDFGIIFRLHWKFGVADNKNFRVFGVSILFLTMANLYISEFPISLIWYFLGLDRFAWLIFLIDGLCFCRRKMWAASCLASCCAACACDACRTVVSGISRRSARIAYCGLFALSLIVSWILREVAAPLMEKMPCMFLCPFSCIFANQAWRS